jgi:HEAT repeat protein
MIEDSSAVEGLLLSLTDSEAEVRSHSAWALGMVGDPGAMDGLIQAMKDESAKVRKQAIWAIGMIQSN